MKSITTERISILVWGEAAEVKESRMLVVTPRFEEASADSDEVRTRASALAEQWLDEYEDFLGAMTGLETLRSSTSPEGG